MSFGGILLIDGRSLPDGERIETDLCIVGAGPAGITLARSMARPGLRVTIIESGGRTRETAADALGNGESVGYPYLGLHETRARGIGGASTHWEYGPSGERWTARPLDPLDFEARPGIPDSGWPIDPSSLEPYYLQAQSIARLGPYAYTPAGWPTDDTQPLPLDPSDAVTNIVQLGDHTFEHYREELAASGAIQVVHDATVLRLVASENQSTITHVDAATRDGRRFSVAARRFALAAGGIENARLMLLSGGPDSPAGLANPHDLVGRYFMERLTARAGVVVPSGPTLLADSGIYRSHVIDGTRIQGVLSLAPAVVRREHLRNAMFWVHERPRAVTSPGIGSVMSIYRLARRRPFARAAIPGHVRRIARDLPDVVRTAARYGLRQTETDPDVLQLGVQAEHAPNRDSRVTLGSGRDAFGLPVARLEWRPTDADVTSIGRSIDLLDGAFHRARLGRIVDRIGREDPPPLFMGNSHHMGTTRMDPDPARGVVDGSGRVHSVTNLFAAGSSVFPTSGFANPTLTIIALALRLADEFKATPWG